MTEPMSKERDENETEQGGTGRNTAWAGTIKEGANKTDGQYALMKADCRREGRAACDRRLRKKKGRLIQAEGKAAPAGCAQGRKPAFPAFPVPHI